jgi:predicted GH43/DUF377 family glycosyl hydrolase
MAPALSLTALAASLLSASLLPGGATGYTVTVTEFPTDPLISFQLGNTAWPQSFNPSWVEPSGNVPGGLLIRSQNCSGVPPGHCIGCNVDKDWPIAPYFPGSVVTFAKETSPGSNTYEAPYMVFGPEPGNNDELYGTEDPRLAFDSTTGLYHLFYTCYGPPGPFLCHATTTDPTLPFPGTWTRLGKVFPSEVGSKSGALLLRPSLPHYLIWGAGVIALATTNNLVNFTTVNTSFITPRENDFDNHLVESGPPPFLLGDGKAYVFFHNSDNQADGCYMPEFVFLNATDPSQILQRAEVPLITPELGWMQGVAPYDCNVPCVAFLEAARRVPDVQGDVFDLFFGGSDAVVGRIRVNVTA